MKNAIRRTLAIICAFAMLFADVLPSSGIRAEEESGNPAEAAVQAGETQEVGAGDELQQASDEKDAEKEAPDASSDEEGQAAEYRKGIAKVVRKTKIYSSAAGGSAKLSLLSGALVYAWETDESRWEILTWIGDGFLNGYVEKGDLNFLSEENAAKTEKKLKDKVHRRGSATVFDMTDYAEPR